MKSLNRPLSLLLLCVALQAFGCVEDADEADPAQLVEGEWSVYVADPWHIPAETKAIGDQQYVAYTGAGAWTGSDACSGGLTTGATQLRTWLNANWPQISSIGGYSCRAINGDPAHMSVHGTGRALDIMIPLQSGNADNIAGDPIGNWLIENAQTIGIQYIIWDGWTWNASKPAGSKDKAYGGAHPHNDHLHIELSVAGGNAQTDWFSGP